MEKILHLILKIFHIISLLGNKKNCDLNFQIILYFNYIIIIYFILKENKYKFIEKTYLQFIGNKNIKERFLEIKIKSKLQVFLIIY